MRVPATSANLGPGFDACGLALGLYDEVTAELTESGLVVEVSGEDSGDRDETHLVVRAMRATFAALGLAPPGLALSCHNAIPHGRGLGSSAAAIVAGVVAAGGLAAGGLSSATALELAGEIEGHPDNVAACLLGGFTVAWREGGRARAARAEPAASIAPMVFVPATRQSTVRSRAALPAHVSHPDAAASAGRAALLALAVASRPDLLVAATEDNLHQPYRFPAMPATRDLVARLRDAGIAAVLSGSGPTVLALGADDGQREFLAAFDAPGFRPLALPVDLGGATVGRNAAIAS